MNPTPKDPIVLDAEGNTLYDPEPKKTAPQMRVFRMGPVGSIALILAIPVLLLAGATLIAVAAAVFFLFFFLSRIFRRI